MFISRCKYTVLCYFNTILLFSFIKTQTSKNIIKHYQCIFFFPVSHEACFSIKSPFPCYNRAEHTYCTWFGDFLYNFFLSSAQRVIVCFASLNCLKALKRARGSLYLFVNTSCLFHIHLFSV